MINFKQIMYATLLSGIVFTSCSTPEQPQPSLTVRFAPQAEAQTLITAEDDFSKGLNAFDIDLRVQKTGSTKDEWSTLAKNETLEWTEEEKNKMTRSIDTLQARIDQLNLDIPFPSEIVLLKTSMKEELGAGGYTRKNWIAIGKEVLDKASEEQLNAIMAHELFHVLSRHDADFKKSVYQTIDFHMTDHEIALPEDALAKRISNPDIAHRNSYTYFDIDGKETPCVQVIYTQAPYTTGDIYSYIKVGFIPLTEQLTPRMDNDTTVIYPIATVKDQFLQKVGQNTGYVIDPEETCAEHFSLLLIGKKDLKNPEIIDQVKSTLQKGV